MSVLKFSERVNKVKPSFTLEMTSRAADLRANGVDVINLSVGEPDFNTPNHIINAGKDAMDSGFTKYTSGIVKGGNKSPVNGRLLGWFWGLSCIF